MEEKEKKKVTDALVEINKGIREGLQRWADIALEAEAKQWAYALTYYPIDLMNATYLFQHVASNIGIKNGHIDEEKALIWGHKLRSLIVEMTGYDPHGILDDLKKVEEGGEG